MIVSKTHSRPFIIPIFLPQTGCPHQCVFCNQTAITGVKSSKYSALALQQTIEEFLQYKTSKRSKVQISFYGGNFLGIEKRQVLFLLCEAQKFINSNQVHGLRFSTRPDTINPKSLALLQEFKVDTVELGVQSMNDRVLAMSKRGHTAADTLQAVSLLKQSGYEIGLQLMIGLPGDDETTVLKGAQQVAELSPDFVRIYPTLVLKNSLLARWYQKGEYTPWPIKKAVNLCKQLYLFFNKQNIPVIRMGLQASSELNNPGTILAGPYHPAFGHLVFSQIFLDKAETLLQYIGQDKTEICIKVNPRSIPKIRGLKNENITTLKKKYRLVSLKIISDPSLNESELLII